MATPNSVGGEEQRIQRASDLARAREEEQRATHGESSEAVDGRDNDYHEVDWMSLLQI